MFVSVALAIPRPHQHIVFQYSLHVLDGPDAEPLHCEYLADHGCDPVPDLTESLKRHIPNDGNVIVWHAPFEKTRNTEMGRLHPEHVSFYESLNRRICDLRDVVKLGSYVHPEFGGSSSIKNVRLRHGCRNSAGSHCCKPSSDWIRD